MPDEDLFLGTDETKLGRDDSVVGEAAGAIGGAIGGLLGSATSVLDQALRSKPDEAGLTDPLGPLPELPDGGPLPEPQEMPKTWGTEPEGPAVPTGVIEPGVVEY